MEGMLEKFYEKQVLEQKFPMFRTESVVRMSD